MKKERWKKWSVIKMEMERYEKEQRPLLSEELAKYLIERVKEHFTKEDGEIFYKEILSEFAPYIFTKRDASEAMVLMEKLLNPQLILS